jgi:hypothetical protein
LAERQDKRRVQHLYGIFEACNDVVVREVARDAADENVAAHCIKAKFRRDAGIGAAKNGDEGVLSLAQRLAFMLEGVRLLTPST